MSRLIPSRSRFRIGASIQAAAFVLLVSSGGVARGQDGLGLGTGTASCTLADTSTITLLNATLPIPPLPATGTLDISIDQGQARCDIIEFDPILISGIGFVCITPAEGCPAGTINCNGMGAACVGDCNQDGVVDVSEAVTASNIALELAAADACPAADVNQDGVQVDDLVASVGNLLNGCSGIDVNVVSNHIIGDCTGNDDCVAQCETYCADLGLEPIVGFGCEGFCDGGDFDGEPCVLDTDCTNGSCNGADQVPFGNVCECQCADTAAPPPPAEGAISCSLGSNIVVETAAPCDGADVLITVGTRCIPLTTERAEAVLLRANGYICWGTDEPCGTDEDCPEGQECKDTPRGRVCGGSAADCTSSPCPDGQTCGTARIGPVNDTGAPADCSAAAEGSFSGTSLRGYVNFFGSTIGDLVTKNSIDCQ